LEPTGPIAFDRKSPPRATVEFAIDAQSLAKAAHVDLEADAAAGKKWELSETGEGELRFRVRVPRDSQEAFADAFHVSEPSVMRVVNRPLRVLLFASSASRDYQFLRSILVREMDKKRAELAIYLQLPPGVTERHGGIVQDVPAERLLDSFPTRLEASDKDDKLKGLDQYDVIVAFDPDWEELNENQLKMVERWVEKGGGLIALGGPINTVRLAPHRSRLKKLGPILDLYPVQVSDVRNLDLDPRLGSEPWPLRFTGATPDMEFLKLEEGEEGVKFLDDWNTFFWGKDGKQEGEPQNGFYSCYPIDKVKTTSVVVARFTDPKIPFRAADGKIEQQPYLVMT
ncbi:MAG: hypothetical protein ACRELF_29665, partial [Gemmataceae bacterium]